MNFLRRLGDLVRRYYDRVLAVLAVVVLIGAAAWSIIRLGAMQLGQHDFANWMAAASPAHPEAPVADVAPYERAEANLKTPPQFQSWTNAIFVPETRCYCVDCLRPITFETMLCPFCGFQQPPTNAVVGLDTDFDGMTDEWERDHKLDPRNREDAALDNDGDGFTNLEEFKADTDPNDAASHPAYASKLVMGPVVSEPFRLLFKSISKMQDGSLKFAINTRTGNRTYFVKLHEQVEGFEVYSFEEKFEDRVQGGIKQKANVSILTLRRGSKLIPLTYGELKSYEEHHVSLILVLDQSALPIKLGEPFDVRGESYKVIAIDMPKETVVLERLSDHQRFDIRKQSLPAVTK